MKHVTRTREATARMAAAPLSPRAPDAQRLTKATVQRAQAAPATFTSADLLAMQRTLGNETVTRLVSGNDAGDGRVASPAPTIQPKLSVGSSDDRFEREANQVARQVVGGLAGTETGAPPTAKNIASLPRAIPASAAQRRTASQAPAPQAPTFENGGEVSSEISGEIQRARGGGKPLDTPVRSAMEQAFGADFGGVRVYQSPQADMLNRSLSARAFTTGQDLFFRQGTYNPTTTAGKGLLAHELTHVVQQSGGQLQRAYAAKPRAEDRLPAAQQVASSGRALGRSPMQIAQRAPHGRIHRCGDDEKKQEKTEPKSTPPPVTVTPSSGTKPESTPPTTSSPTMSSPKGGSTTSPPVTKPPVTTPVDTSSDLGPSGGTTTTTVTAPTTSGARDTTTAVATINSSSLGGEYKARALELLGNPNLASQAGFGICGLTSILRSILLSDPDRFATLAIQTLADTAFVNEWQPIFQTKAAEHHKKAKKELDFLVAHWLLRKSTTGQVSQKVLKRNDKGGMDEITKTKDYAKVFEAQKDFSDTFKMKDWDVDGHYATTAGGLNYLYSSLTGKEGFKIKITDFAKDYQVAKSKAGTNGTINASIKGHDFYRAKGVPVDVGPAEKHPAKYRHWVTITDMEEKKYRNKSGGVLTYIKLKIWTYEGFHDALVREDVIGDYIHSLVVM